MEEHFIAELKERLITHYSAGAWRVPLGARQHPGGAYGPVICADDADLARAQAGLRPLPAPPREAEVWGALTARATLFAELRSAEGAMGDALARRAMPVLPDQGPYMLLTSAEMPLADLAALLVAAAGKGGLIWKPAPAAAASAHLLGATLAPLLGPAMALVQGDHITGAALAGRGPLIWASHALPSDSLPSPVVSLARSQGRP